MLWSRLPLLKILIPFAFGIWLADLFHFAHIEFVVLSFLLAVLLFELLNKRRRGIALFKGITFQLLFLFFGYYLAQMHFKHDQAFKANQDANAWIADVKTVLKLTDYYHKYIIELKAKRLNTEWNKQSGRLLLKQKRGGEEPYLPSDRIMILGNCVPVPSALNPEQFDYADYMKYQHIYYELRSENTQLLRSSNSIVRMSEKWRRRLIDSFSKTALSKENLPILQAILLGDKSDLDTEIRDDFSRAGAMHVLAVSGLHLGIVFLFFDHLLKLFRPRKRSLKKGIILCAILWGFAILTGLSNSVMRSALMFSFLILADVLNRNSSSLNSVAASALILLIADPLRLFQLGFQLSYSAVFGILLIYPPLAKLLKSRSAYLNKLSDLLLISIAAQLSTLPLILAYFHQFPNLFLITNIVVIPLAFVLVAGGVSLSILLLAFDSSFGLDYLLDIIFTMLRKVVHWLSSSTYSVTEGIWLEPASIFLILFATILMLSYLQSRKANRLLILSTIVMLICVNETIALMNSGRQEGFTVYSTNPVKAISIRKAYSAELFTFDSLNGYEEDMIHDHLNALNIRAIESRTIKLNRDSILELEFNGKRGLVVPNSKIPIKTNSSLDFIVLNDYLWKPINEIDSVADVLIANSYRDSIEANNIHNLRDSAYNYHK